MRTRYRTDRGGKLSSYIPEPARVNPNLFAIAITDISGQTISFGDLNTEFTLQFVSKPFVYGLAATNLGRNCGDEFVGSG